MKSYESHNFLPDTTISLTSYNLQYYDFSPGVDSPEVLADLSKDRVNWISVIGYRDLALIERLGNQFQLHSLTLEDILNTDHLPKIEPVGDTLFITMKMFTFNSAEDHFEEEHVSFILGTNFLLTFQEKEGDDFNIVRERIRNAVGKVRSKGHDYLFYLLVDRIVDNYYIVLDKFEEKMDLLEDELIDNPNPTMAGKILALKKQMIQHKKYIFPLREEFGRLLKDENRLITKSATAYLRDVHDHILHLVNTIESFRENLNGLMELHFSNNSARMNSVMKTLTMITTIFIPLSFLAGIYGMNFRYMPELDYPWAYPAALGLMLLIGVSMYLYMKRKKWL
jgi:magnesium transporter